MFNTYKEYKQQYLKSVYNLKQYDCGYFTQSKDDEHLIANSVFVDQINEHTLLETYNLAAETGTITRIEIANQYEYADEFNEYFLLEYSNEYKSGLDQKLDIMLVNENNIVQYQKMSDILQKQEYGSIYKSNMISEYLLQEKYQLFIVVYEDQFIGEFIFIPSHNIIESIILLKEFQGNGLGSKLLTLIGTKLTSKYYLSADKQSVSFYEKNKLEIIDSIQISTIYAAPKNMSTYLMLLMINGYF